MKYTTPICLLFLLLSLVISPVYADDDKAVLSRIVHELNALDTLITDAQNAPKQAGSRLQFNYGALRNDFALIRNGLDQYIKASHALPRAQPIKPLNGNYSQ